MRPISVMSSRDSNSGVNLGVTAASTELWRASFPACSLSGYYFQMETFDFWFGVGFFLVLN